MNDASPILEVIVTSVEDAIEAESGGAGRLEVVSELARGGMTPSLELVREIADTVSIKVRVMLRASDGYRVSGEKEVETLCANAHDLAALNIDGLVLGFTKDRSIDVALTQRALSCAPNLNATFHHAFEDTREPLESIGRLKAIKQIDRLLTHGGDGDWLQKLARLAIYSEAAKPEITILAGGGLDYLRIQAIRANTMIKEFHVGRAARSQCRVDGAVKAERVRMLVAAMGGEPKGSKSLRSTRI